MNLSELSQNGDDIRGFKLSEIKIGTWYTRCCHQDLYKIETEDELTKIISDLTPDEDGEIEPWACIDFWNTKLEALQDILGWSSDENDIKEIEDLLVLENRKLIT